MVQVKERGGGGEERKETLADKPLDFENRPLGLSCLSSCTDIKFWNQILMLSSAVIIHWPIKCLALDGEISMNPNDQCRLCSFVLLIRLKGTTTRVKFWSFSSKLPESWILKGKMWQAFKWSIFDLRRIFIQVQSSARQNVLQFSPQHRKLE